LGNAKGIIVTQNEEVSNTMHVNIALFKKAKRGMKTPSQALYFQVYHYTAHPH